MLLHLSIRDFVLVKTLALDFQTGLTTLTGETGAGKSIVLDAVGLLLGDRSDARYLREGADNCELAAEFDLSKLAHAQQWLTEQDIPFDSEDQIVQLRRVIAGNGRSRCFINGSLQPVGQLKQLGEFLIDIHGQNEHQSLGRSPKQREIIDNAIADQNILATVAEHYHAYQQAEANYKKALNGQQEDNQRIQFLSFQHEELVTLATNADEIHDLDQEQTQLSHSEQLLNVCHQALDFLREQDQSAESMLTKFSQQCQELNEISAPIGEAGTLLDNALININEAADSLEKFVNTADLDPSRLEWVETRLADIFRLARKHKIEPEKLPEFQQKIEHELAELVEQTADPETLSKRRDEAQRTYHKAAEKLTAARQKIAEQLSDKITETMQTLGMKGGQFTVKLEPMDQASQFGNERIRFYVAANPGQSLAPLGDVASGGEISRISLAIQVSSAGSQLIPTLIFDEVDTGIGGKTAAVVGMRMRQLAQHQQILAVTHLPQVAASGHQQLEVQKSTDGVATSTTVEQLSESSRIEEIARMLGSEKLTDTAKANAAELIALQASGD
jgi:DNA repair protein RecN (Recombination protein N)